MLRLGNEIMCRDGGNLALYLLPQADLEHQSEPAQIQLLTMHIGVLNSILNRPQRKRARSCETRGSAGQDTANRRRTQPPPPPPPPPPSPPPPLPPSPPNAAAAAAAASGGQPTERSPGEMGRRAEAAPPADEQRRPATAKQDAPGPAGLADAAAGRESDAAAGRECADQDPRPAVQDVPAGHAEAAAARAAAANAANADDAAAAAPRGQAQAARGIVPNIRAAVLTWLRSKATDPTFQAAKPDVLVRSVCAFVKEEVLPKLPSLSGAGARSVRHNNPAARQRFLTTVASEDCLWEVFQQLKQSPANVHVADLCVRAHGPKEGGASNLNGGCADQNLTTSDLSRNLKREFMHSTTTRCRAALATWLPVMALDDSFQPQSAEDLFRKAHRFLCDTIQGFTDSYRFPSKLHKFITSTEVLWANFQGLRLKNRPEGGGSRPGHGGQGRGSESHGDYDCGGRPEHGGGSESHGDYDGGERPEHGGGSKSHGDDDEPKHGYGSEGSGGGGDSDGGHDGHYGGSDNDDGFDAARSVASLPLPSGGAANLEEVQGLHVAVYRHKKRLYQGDTGLHSPWHRSCRSNLEGSVSLWDPAAVAQDEGVLDGEGTGHRDDMAGSARDWNVLVRVVERKEDGRWCVASRNVHISCKNGDTVAKLKERLGEKEGFVGINQTWIFAGRELGDEETVGFWLEAVPDVPWFIGDSGERVVTLVASESFNVGLVLAMGLHPRLGANSPLRVFTGDILPAILAQVGRIVLHDRAANHPTGGDSAADGAAPAARAPAPPADDDIVSGGANNRIVDPPEGFAKISLGQQIKELSNLGLKLDSKVVLLARKSDLFQRLDAPRAQWSSHPTETYAEHAASLASAEGAGVAIALYVFGYISEAEYKLQSSEGNREFEVTEKSDQQARIKALRLMCHPDQGATHFCKENRITNRQDWSPLLGPILTRAFRSLQCAQKVAASYLDSAREESASARPPTASAAAAAEESAPARPPTASAAAVAPGVLVSASAQSTVPTLRLEPPVCMSQNVDLPPSPRCTGAAAAAGSSTARARRPVAAARSASPAIDLTEQPFSPTRQRPPPVISRHNLFAHGLDGNPFPGTFDNLMDLVQASLRTVGLDCAASAPQRRVVLRLIEFSNQIQEPSLRQEVLQTLAHRECMHADIIDWFLTLFCRTCGIDCACEGDGLVDCVEAARCPFNDITGKPNLAVWGVTLFEKIMMCKDGSDAERLLQEGPMQRYVCGRNIVAFCQGSSCHFTAGAITLQTPNSDAPSVWWRCSMQWKASEETKMKGIQFVRALTGKVATWTEIPVPKQRRNECAPRSMLELAHFILAVCQGREPSSLSVRRQKAVNADSDKFRTLLALSIYKSMASAGKLDFEAALLYATSVDPQGGIYLFSDTDEEDSPADSSAGGVPSGDLGAVEALRFTPNTSSAPKDLILPSSKARCRVPYGTIEGGVSVRVGDQVHRFELTRKPHKTKGTGSCGFIAVGQTAVAAFNDKRFFATLQRRAPLAAQRLQEIADLSASDTLACRKLRGFLFRVMRGMPKEICSSFWKSDPSEREMNSGKNLAEKQNIDDEALRGGDYERTRGDKWAIAVFNPAVQLDEGYLSVLMWHFDNTIGFIIFQRRKPNDSCIPEANDQPYVYFHYSALDQVSNETRLIWPLLHLVSDRGELSNCNHFEYMSAGTAEDPSSSIFFLDQHANDVPQEKGGGSVSIDNGNGAGGPLRQASISEFFGPPTQDKLDAGSGPQSDQGPSEQGQIDCIVDCLQTAQKSMVAVDKAIRIYFDRILEGTKHESLRSIIQSSRGQGSTTLILLEDRLRRYIDTVIAVASAVLSDDDAHANLKHPLQGALCWVWEITIAGRKTKIAPEEILHRWRESIRPLLMQDLASSESQSKTDSSKATQADFTDSEATAKQAVPECCFKCGSRDDLWGCCHVFSDGTRCRIGYCFACMYTADMEGVRKPSDWCCRIHWKRGQQPMNMSKCWECPREAQNPELIKGCVPCDDCGVLLCRMHGIVSGQKHCFVCRGREALVARVRTDLRRLMNKFTNFSASKDVILFKASDVLASKRITSDKLRAVYDFARMVQDAHHSTLREAVNDYVHVLIQVNFAMATYSSGRADGFSTFGVPSSPSQLLRLVGGDERPANEGAARIVKVLSEAAARELVSLNSPSASPGDRWAPWSLPHAIPKDGIKAAIWLGFGAARCPEVDLLAAVLVDLERFKSSKLASVVLCVRRLSAATGDGGDYDSEYGACRKLIGHYASIGAIKWFPWNASDEEIHSYLVGEELQTICSVAGFNDGNIAAVFAKEPRAAPCICELLAYPSPMYGVVDFTMLALQLPHPDHLHDPDRERAFIVENPYSCVGPHNGHDAPSKEDMDRIQLPPEGSTVLLFTGSLDKLSKPTVHMFCRILSGAGKNAVLAHIYSTDLSVDSVHKWVQDYNRSVEPGDAIAPRRLFIFPYRSKELFWAFLRAIRWRCLSISTRSSYDVHTTVGDAMSNHVCHMAITNGVADETCDKIVDCKSKRGQMWAQNVPVLLVEQAGLGQYLIAKGEDDAVAKATFWLLNPAMIQAGSTHLEQCADEQSGYFDRQRLRKDLELALVLGFEEVVRVNGNRADMRDIDLRKHGDRPAVCKAFIPPGSAPWYVISETALTQFDRLMKQAAIWKLTWKGMEFLFQEFVAVHHGMGHRGMHIIGYGSSVVCIKSAYRGDSITGVAENGQELVLKANHFARRNLRQENRMKYDAIPTALRLHDAAYSRRDSLAAHILPTPLGLYPGGCAAGFVRYDGRDNEIYSSARDRPVLCFGAFQLISEGSLYISEIVKRIVSQYRAEGVVSNDMVRLAQGIMHSTHVMNQKGCFCMDISWGNLAVREINGRFIVTWMDTGGSMVISPAKRDDARPLMRASTSFAAGPDAGPVNGKRTPHLHVCKQSKTKKSSIGFLSTTTIRALYASDSACRTCSGTQGFRDEVMVKELDAIENRKKPLDVAFAKRFDSASSTICIVRLFHGPPRDAAKREQWEKDLHLATGSKEAMLNFLLQGIEKPDARADARASETLNAFADLLYKSLREEDRFGAKDALISKALSSKVWSKSQMQDLKGEGIWLKEGSLICPAGWSEAEWKDSKWATFKHPPLTLKEEFNSEGVSMGVGVQTPNALREGDFIGLYAGSEASGFTSISLDDLPPCRYTTYALDRAGGVYVRLHVVAEQPVEWFLESRVVGPFLNGVMGKQRMNVRLNRFDFFRSKDGILYLAMYAAKDIAAFEFLRWKYDPRAGGGGADSYMFPLD